MEIEIADRYGSMIVLEDLKGLKVRASEKSRRLAWLFTQLAYRKLQSYVECKAAWRGLRRVYVPARGTSKASPMGRVKRLNYCWMVLPNGAATTRDVVAAWNLTTRGLKQMRGSQGSRGALIAPRSAGMRTRPKRGNGEGDMRGHSRIFPEKPERETDIT